MRTGLKDTPGNTFMGLSVVIIARNEAKNIARTIESVLRAVEQWQQAEILLVDSASTDETVEIAKRYPVNIVRLKASWYLSAAAGRYIGTYYTNGDLILFLDGDMELDPEWLNHAVPYAREHSQVAALGGYLRDVYMRDGQVVGEIDCGRDPQGGVFEGKFVTGAMLCRRSALQQVGGFQPFIKSEEEIDLSMRLRRAGFILVRLPYLICRHYCIPMGSLAGTLRRFRLDLWLGFGQVPRYYWGSKLFWMYLKERGAYTIIYLMGVLTSLITLLLTLFSENIVFFGSWTLIVAGVILGFAIKKRSIHEVLLSCLIQTCVAYSAVRGFLLVPRSRDEYPTDPEIIRRANQMS